jgi:hypothetical protein
MSGFEEKSFVTIIPSGSDKPIDTDRLKKYVSDCLAKDDVFKDRVS